MKKLVMIEAERQPLKLKFSCNWSYNRRNVQNWV